MGVAVASGVDWKIALLAGLDLALSSTAIALQAIGERHLMVTSSRSFKLPAALSAKAQTLHMPAYGAQTSVKTAAYNLSVHAERTKASFVRLIAMALFNGYFIDRG